MNLLDNELVRKYFSPNCGCITSDNKNEDCMGKFASGVLDAMQQPIRKGERLLCVSGCESEILAVYESVADKRWDDRRSGFHAFWLRLPDAFQKPKGCQHDSYSFMCTNCGKPFEQPIGKPAPSPEGCEGGEAVYYRNNAKDAVEEKIVEIRGLGRSGSHFEMEADQLEKHLRDLVRIARETK